MIVDDDYWLIVVIHGIYLPVIKHGLLPFSSMIFPAINLNFSAGVLRFPTARPALITGG